MFGVGWVLNVDFAPSKFWPKGDSPFNPLPRIPLLMFKYFQDKKMTLLKGKFRTKGMFHTSSQSSRQVLLHYKMSLYLLDMLAKVKTLSKYSCERNVIHTIIEIHVGSMHLFNANILEGDIFVLIWEALDLA